MSEVNKSLPPVTERQKQVLAAAAANGSLHRLPSGYWTQDPQQSKGEQIQFASFDVIALVRHKLLVVTRRFEGAASYAIEVKPAEVPNG